MHELTTYIQEKVPLYTLFAHNIVLVDELIYDMNAKLRKWREALESKGLKISHTKAKYKNCTFSEYVQRTKTSVRTEALEIPKKIHFDTLIIS